MWEWSARFSSEWTSSVVEDAPDRVLLHEALGLIDDATKDGITVRLMGALGIERRCPGSWRIARSHGRTTADVDLIGLNTQWDRLIRFFEAKGYDVDERHAMLHGKERLNFFHDSGFRVDVFLDKLSMCHAIDLRQRMEVHSETIPLADLLLQKVQIVELTHKDEIDAVVLLHEHDIGSDESSINAAYIARLLSSDWGFYHTATQNMFHLHDESIYKLDVLSHEDRAIVLRRLEKLVTDIEARPKSLAWKARGKIGTRIKWYREVGELVR